MASCDITRETMQEHRATWWVYAGGNGMPLRRIRRAATMRGFWPGYDVTCSCGWDSKTGGATRTWVERDLYDHRLDAQLAKEAV